MSLASLSEAMKKEFMTLGLPAVLEMAVVSTSGKVLYSDLSKAAMGKISPFYDSLLMMGEKDNLSLALDASKTIVASRVSSKAILIVITDKKSGIIITKMGSVSDKFGKLLDELIILEESRAGGEQPSREAPPEAKPSPPPPEPSVEEVEPPAPPPSSRPSASTVSASSAPPPPEQVSPKGVAPVSVTSAAASRKSTERVIVPKLNDVKILEKCPDKDRKFLELFDGTLSLGEIAKRLGVPFFDALQVANKYKNQGKVDVKEIIRR